MTFDTPVMRAVARKEFPSTRAAIILERSDVLRRFIMIGLCMTAQAYVKSLMDK